MSATPASDLPTTSDRAVGLWQDHLSEQASTVRSAALALTSSSPGDWRESCAVVLTIELAKLRALIAAAPMSVPVSPVIHAHREGATALAETPTQP